MELAIKKIFELFEALFLQVNSYGFSFNGFKVGYIEVFLAFICLSMIISLFWKGGRG